MKRALVSFATFAVVGASACGSSNPTPSPYIAPQDGGQGERGVIVVPPDTRPPAAETAPDQSLGNDAVDAPPRTDGLLTGIDSGAPPIVTVTIQNLGATGADGGAVVAGDGGSAGVPVYANTDRLAPTVSVEVRSQGGDATGDVVVSATAVLLPMGSATPAAKITLNQTDYKTNATTKAKIYGYGDAPFDLVKLATGQYTLTVTAVTASGTVGTASTPIFVDGGASITFLSPADKVFVRGSLLATVVVLDGHAGVASVTFSVGQVQLESKYVSSNGAQYTATLDFGSFNPPLDGPQVLTVTAVNGNGVVALASRSFTVDNAGPTITGTKPGTGGLIGKLITIEASVSDPAGVMEDSVVAVIAHGDVHFEVRLEKGAGTVFSNVFDTTQLPVYALFPSISFRAQDVLGNQSSVGYLVSLDNTPPILDLDPPDTVRLFKKDGTCSWPFDPVGPDAVDDGAVVNQLFDIRARIEDEGNMPLTGIPDFTPIAGVDPATVKVLLLDDTSLPLVVDTSDPPDGICDDLNPELVPSVAPQSSRDAQLLDMVSLAPAGSGDFSYQPGIACSGNGQAPDALCLTTYSPAKDDAMTYVMSYANSLPSIWTVPPVVSDSLQCAGRQFDASNNVHDGWACLAVIAADKLGNQQVSRPIRICVAATPGSTACTAAASGGADLASVTLPSLIGSKVVVTTKAAVVGPGGAAVAKGDTLVVSQPSPPAVAVIGGDHVAEPQGSSGTQFSLSDVNVAPFQLWLDPLDGTQPVFKGSVGLVISDGVDIQVVTDQSGTSLAADFTGAVVLIARSAKVTATDRRWAPANIQATGFSLKSSAVKLSGFATAAARLPNCTGTLVKGAPGMPVKVDATIPCAPWASFPQHEYIEIK